MNKSLNLAKAKPAQKAHKKPLKRQSAHTQHRTATTHKKIQRQISTSVATHSISVPLHHTQQQQQSRSFSASSAAPSITQHAIAQPSFALPSLAKMTFTKNKNHLSLNTLASSYGFAPLSNQRRFNSTTPTTPTTPATSKTVSATEPITQTKEQAQAQVVDAATAPDATTTETPELQEAPKVQKPPGKMTLMYRKYGRIAVASYFGVYFGFMAAFPAMVHLTPSSVFDATQLIDWCYTNGHGVGMMDWVSSQLDKHPQVGERVRADPKLSADIGAGLLLNELAEPLRIPLSIGLMKYFGDKKAAKAAATANAAVAVEGDELKTEVTPTILPIIPTTSQPIDIKETKSQQVAV